MIGYIYKTTNLKTHKIYIGQHLSEKFEPNRYIGSGALLKQAILKYGFKNFKCELLCECNTIEELNEKEKYYIAVYGSQDRSIGYNIASGGDEPWNRNKKMSLQYCKRDSIAQRNNAPNICCFDLSTGRLLNIFNSCYDAAEFVNACGYESPLKVIGSRIHTVCKTKKGHAYNHIWRFESDFLGITQLSQNELLLEHTNPRAKIIQQFDLQNHLVAEFESAAAYSKTITTDYKEQRRIARGINGCCVGDSVTYKGFVWRYKN